MTRARISRSRRFSRICRRKPEPMRRSKARVLVMVGDSVTTDHISPAGAIKKDSPAGKYLMEHGVTAARFQQIRLAPRQ